MATGEVILLGTQIGTAGSYANNGNTISKATDGDFLTNWDAPDGSGSTNWVGVDLGSGNSAIPTEVRFAPRTSDSSSGYMFENRMFGSKVDVSNDPAFGSGVSTLYTVPSTKFTPSRQYNVAALGGSTGYRCVRWLAAANSYGSLAEVQFIGRSATGNAQPVDPTVSPCGGRFPLGKTTVTITSRTTSASVYYTTDGTTPTTSSTLYTGPFTLTVGSATTLKVIAYDNSCSTATSPVTTCVFRNTGFKAAEDLKDDRNILIEAHGGNILDNTARDGYFYWYGAEANGVNGSGSHDINGNFGVWCYKSKDLLNWTFVDQILDNTSNNWTYLERPRVVYNASTGYYVLWVHGANYHNSTDRACIARSTSPDSGWTWYNASLDPDGLGFKDFQLFVDDDGTGYVVYVNGDQGGTTTITCSRLASNYLSTDGTNKATLSTGTNREAPILFKRNSTYFWITSSGNYYDSSSTFDPKYQVSTAANPLSGFGSLSSLFASDPVGTTNNAQPSFVLKIPGRDGWMYGADRWNQTQLYDSRQVWLPLTFPTSTTTQASIPSSWTLSTFNLSSTPVVTGPTGGATGSPSTAFTYSLQDGAFFAGDETVTITATGGTVSVTLSGDGTITNNGTSTVAVQPAAPATSFTYTFTPTSAGVKSLTYTNGQSWTNPASSTYTGASTGPTLSSPAIDATGLTLTATLSTSGCTPTSGSGTGGFSVGNLASVTSWSISGTTLTLNLSGRVPSGIAVNYGYDGTAGIQDGDGNALATFSNVSVTNNSTIPTPALSSIAVAAAGTTITATISSGCTPTTGTTGFAAFSANNGQTYNNLPWSISGTTLTIPLPVQIRTGDTVTLSYYPEGAAPSAIVNSYGIQLDTFEDTAVTNNSLASVPTLASPTVPTGGTTITATLSKSGCLPASGTGDAGFAITTAAPVSITGWTITSTTLTLSLQGHIPQSQAVSVSYTAGTITDAYGVPMATFGSTPATNNSTFTATNATISKVEISGWNATAGTGYAILTLNTDVLGDPFADDIKWPNIQYYNGSNWTNIHYVTGTSAPNQAAVKVGTRKIRLKISATTPPATPSQWRLQSNITSTASLDGLAGIALGSANTTNVQGGNSTALAMGLHTGL